VGLWSRRRESLGGNDFVGVTNLYSRASLRKSGFAGQKVGSQEESWLCKGKGRIGSS
jgi:hypothetical protein